MKEDDLLLPIDQSKLTNLPNMKHIYEHFMNFAFDLGNEYSIPYFWGTLGIAYNPTLLEGTELKAGSDLWDPESLNQEVSCRRCA